ncbi:MAG: segregation/condensation protein A, partial [Candidatus Omnitrophica bacterium]|nr:segregation/condensation protein A [Candidatus Omnitrophota bacterium]
SKLLLPVLENQQLQEEIEDPRQELVKQLLEYERFKEIAQELREREIGQRDIFKRPKSEEPPKPDVRDVKEPFYFEASIFDLINAFSKALEDAPKELFYQVIKDEFTIEEKVHTILHMLLVRESVKISELFTQAKNKLEVIVTFLSILELMKLKEISAFQKEPFGEIEIGRNREHMLPREPRGLETQ